MAKLISKRERVCVTRHYLDYQWNDEPGSGFSFDCTENGLLLAMAPEAVENFISCITGAYDVGYGGVKQDSWTYTNHAVIECIECRAHVSLSGFTNTCCECGADYSMDGSRLAPREQWGEETGEHWTECY
jgi:hypothetical protein